MTLILNLTSLHFARFDQFRGSAFTQPLFRHGPSGEHDQGRNASEIGQPNDGSESPKSGLLRPLPPESGGQGEEHVHLHGLHPHRHEDDPRLVRGAGRPRGHGVGHQSGCKQKKRSGQSELPIVILVGDFGPSQLSFQLKMRQYLNL